MACRADRARSAVLLALLLCCGCRCGEVDPAEPGRVLLIGLDGAEWSVIRPMAAAGDLPNLARLIETGAHGNLRSLEPRAVSPAIWTWIATGKPPAAHRIEAFTAGQRNLMTTGNARAVEAFWNVASKAGRTVGIVGWLVTWPAENVNGFMISDKILSTKISDGRTYPAELSGEIEPLLVRSESMPWSSVQRYLDAPLEPAPDQETEKLLDPLKWISAADLSSEQIAKKLYRERRPDLMAVYLRGLDSVGHHFWSYMEPEAVPPERLNRKGLKLLKGTVRAYYRFVDEQIGELLELADDRTTVVVVSDHGFTGGPGRPLAQHGLDGVLVMAGHGVKPGEITGATVYDVTPTLLVLLGIPPAKDMPGKVLWPALVPAIPKERYAPVATYETGRRRTPGPPIERPLDDETREQLRSLGYLQ